MPPHFACAPASLPMSPTDRATHRDGSRSPLQVNQPYYRGSGSPICSDGESVSIYGRGGTSTRQDSPSEGFSGGSSSDERRLKSSSSSWRASSDESGLDSDGGEVRRRRQAPTRRQVSCSLSSKAVAVSNTHLQVWGKGLLTLAGLRCPCCPSTIKLGTHCATARTERTAGRSWTG
jgi:hypothetical protein